jgi:hypothetical protein
MRVLWRREKRIRPLAAELTYQLNVAIARVWPAKTDRATSIMPKVPLFS